MRPVTIFIASIAVALAALVSGCDESGIGDYAALRDTADAGSDFDAESSVSCLTRCSTLAPLCGLPLAAAPVDCAWACTTGVIAAQQVQCVEAHPCTLLAAALFQRGDPLCGVAPPDQSGLVE